MLDTSLYHIRNFDKFIEIKEMTNLITEKPKSRNQYTSPVIEQMKKDIDKWAAEGYSYTQIGEKMGKSKSAVSGIVYRDRIDRKKKRNVSQW